MRIRKYASMLAWMLALALLAALPAVAFAEDFSDIPMIDMEHHYYAQDVLDYMATRTELPIYNPEGGTIEYAPDTWMGFPPSITDLGEGRIAEMDENHVAMAMLSSSPGLEMFGGEEEIEYCKRCNDLVYETMQAYPGRFFGSAILPVSHVEAACDELERCVKELGFVCWFTHSSYGEKHLDDPEFRPILKKAEELGVFLYLHPIIPIDERINKRGYAFSAAGFGFTADALQTALQMITDGVFDECPDLKMVMGHLGETAPFLMQRMDRFLSRDFDPSLKNQHRISDYFRDNIWVTTSGNMEMESFELTKAVLGIDHIMVGLDYPYESMADEVAFHARMDLTREEREMLYYGNALKLMRIAEPGTDGVVTPALIGRPTDYSDPENWIALPEITAPADTVYFYPTVNDPDPANAPDIYPIDSEVLKSEGARLYRQQALAFDGVTNVFAPYYRGTNILTVMAHSDDPESYQKYQQRTDVFAALDYYFENLNGGRPFILAGHSQGSMMIRIVLDEYMRLHPELLERMVAAYAIGESFPRDWLEAHPYVKFAEGADDTGVIVAWNTEGPGNAEAFNMVVEEGAVSINPINWKRDDTYAPAEENLGSQVANEAGEYEIVPGINDAQVNVERGVVVCTTSDSFVPLAPLFGPESLHGVDFDLYYQNIRENAQTRVNAWLAANE